MVRYGIDMPRHDLTCPWSKVLKIGHSHGLVPGGGVLHIPGIRECATWQVWFGEKLPYRHKGPHLKFCLTKESLFCPKSALQKGPFLLKIEVSPLKNACFANFKHKILLKSTESYIFRHFFLICLKTGSKFRRRCPLSKGGVQDPEVAHPRTKIREEPPPPGGLVP